MSVTTSGFVVGLLWQWTTPDSWIVFRAVQVNIFRKCLLVKEAFQKQMHDH